MKQIVSIILILLFATQIIAQDEIEATATKGVLIVAAGKNYEAIKKMAKEVAEKTGYKLDLRDLEYHPNEGLSFKKEICEEEGIEYPFYIARGRWDDGEFISVEYTNAYEGFTPGYYIIVASTHDKGSPELQTALQHVKKFYKSAYIKYADVYMGDIH